MSCRKCGKTGNDELFTKYTYKNISMQGTMCKVCDAAQSRKWYQNNVFRKKDYDLRRKFGVGFDEVLDKYNKQDKKCAICFEAPTESMNKRKGTVLPLVLDHNHKTGKNRDLLCSFCNSGLGYFKENESIMENAIKYIRRHCENK